MKRPPIGIILLGVLWICLAAQGIFDAVAKHKVSVGIASVVFLVLALNVLFLRNWARIAIMICIGTMTLFVSVIFILMLLDKVEMAAVSKDKIWMALIPLVIYGVGVVWYLTRPKVKSQFK